MEMDLLRGINYPAVVVSTIVYYVLGFLWYTVFFGDIWRRETGVAEKGPSKPPASSLVGQFISTLLYSFGIAIFLKWNGSHGITDAIFVTVVLTIFFIIPVNSGNLFFTGKKKLFLLDVCERALGSFIVAIIIGIWN